MKANCAKVVPLKNGVRQTKDDLLNHLREQIRFLDASGKSFDAGFEGEAKRIATVLRVLLFDSKKQRSLLGQLGLKPALRFHSVVETPAAATIAFVGLTIKRDPGGWRYDPSLNVTKQKLAFDDWWSAPILINTVEGVRVTRADSILSLANQDGGAHVDPALDPDYAGLSRSNAFGWIRCGGPPGGKAFENAPTPAIVRQTGHEVLGTLREQLRELLPEFRE